MAILSLSDAIKLAKQPRNTALIDAAIAHEERIRLHTQPRVALDGLSDADETFLTRIDALLGEENKAARFRQCYNLPVATSSLADKIFSEYPRVLEAQDQYIKNTFTTDAAEQDFKQYLEDINFYKFWRNDGMNALRKYINAFIVTDLPGVQITAKPAPYFYLLYINDVYDVRFNDKMDVEYILFYQPAPEGVTRLAVIDDTTIKFIIKTKDSVEWKQDGEEVPHNQPYCPVCKFYPEVIDKDNPANSKSPVSDSLGDLDNLLFDRVATKYAKLYMKWPIYYGYKPKCEYYDDTVQGTCNGNGQIVYQIESDSTEGCVLTRTKPCPNCANGNLLGPGTMVWVDPPASSQDADLQTPVGKLDASVDAIQQMDTDLYNEECRILYNTTGKTPVTDESKQAVNIPQIESTLESRKSVLINIKKNLERTMQFVLECMGRYRAGKQFISSTVDLGTDWFLLSEAEMLEDYQANKNAGMPVAELGNLQDMILAARYGNNPEKMQRIAVQRAIEQWRTYSDEDLIANGLYRSNWTAYVIKTNLPAFIDRFEREYNTTITQFASLLSWNTKINLILQQFKIYTDEYKEPQAPVGNQAGMEGESQTAGGGTVAN